MKRIVQVGIGTVPALALVLAAGGALADGGAGGSGGGQMLSGGAGGTALSPDGGDGVSDGNSYYGSGGGGGSVSVSAGVGDGAGFGGDGGQGGATVDGPGGAGGTGGTPGRTSATPLENAADLTGHSGGNGSSSPPGMNGPESGGAGGGGAGGFGWVIGASGDSSNAASVTGGHGGSGGYGQFGGGGGGGGQGGGGLLLLKNAQLTLSSTSHVAGGDGGSAGGNIDYGGPGSGGDGGDGILLMSGGRVTNSAGAVVVGGKGGSTGSYYGGLGGMGDYGNGGSGGAGVAGDNLTLINAGRISGGAGAAMEYDLIFGPYGGGTGGTGGAGGVGVLGSDLVVINSGEISGGTSGQSSYDGMYYGMPGMPYPGVTARADAIRFTSGTNRLELQAGYSINGNVVANGDDTLTLGGDADANFNAGGIGGSAQYQGFEAFEKTGHSVWTLTGATTAVTPWRLEGGTLSVSGDGQLGDAAGRLTFSGGALAMTGAGFESARAVTLDGIGTVNVDSGTSSMLSGEISEGTSGGSLVKTGTGTLTLAGVNTYTGGTTVAAGTLSVSSDPQLGAATGGVTLDGGTLSATDTFTSARGVILRSNGTFDVTTSKRLTLAGVLSGSGDLVKQGDGSLSLSGDNLYDGNTQVQAGDLVGDTGSIRGDIAIADVGVVGFLETKDATFAGDIGGLNGTAGHVAKSGAGTLTLAGTSALDWSIAKGVLKSVSGRFTGNVNIREGASMLFAQGGDGTYGKTVSGSGELRKTGSGILNLTGDSSSFGGHTMVSGGTLNVDGSLGNIESSVKVAAGSALRGSGAVGGGVAVADGGTLAGTAGQTLTMGSLTLSDGSDVNVALGAPADAALFSVGDLTLDGTLNSGEFAYDPGLYRIFDYSGTLTDNGLAVGVTPDGVTTSELAIQTSIGHQINVVYSQNVDTPDTTVRNFWDGGDSARHDNDAVDGGAGTWSLDTPNWTGLGGASNGAYAADSALTLFAGTGGTVTVDDQAGPIAVRGLQFAADRYKLLGDAITLKESGTVIRVGDGTVAGRGFTTSIASQLTGAGGLHKTDLGTLVLTGKNDYKGGTSVSAGTLIGNADSIRGDLANAGTVVFDQAKDATFAGDIAGRNGKDGTLIKRGAGELTLRGKSVLAWTLEKGGLISTTDRFTGDLNIAEGAYMIFDQGTAGTYEGNLSGRGALRFSGGGVVRLTGDNSGLANTSTIRNSTLVVDRSLGGALDIADGGRLQGNGTVGKTTVGQGGTIAPGNATGPTAANRIVSNAVSYKARVGSSATEGDWIVAAGTAGSAQVAQRVPLASDSTIGTLHINGDVAFAKGARYEVEVDPSGSESDRIIATGAATLNGGSVVHIGADGSYNLASTYTILSADQGIDGTFEGVSSDFAFLDPTLGYGANDVTLSLARNDVRFSDEGVTANQRATATGAASLASGNAVYDSIVQLNAPAARGAFDALSGEIHASAKTALIEASRHVRNALIDRMRTVQAPGPNAGASAATSGTQTAVAADGSASWGRVLGSWGETDSNGNAGDLDRSTRGVLVGSDTEVDGNGRIGLMTGYTRTEFSVDGRNATGDSDDFHLGAYGGTEYGLLALRLGAVYSWHAIEASRTASFAGFRSGLQGSHDAGTAQAFAEAGYGIDVGRTELEPFASVAYVNLDSDGFTERGGDAALRVRGDDTDTTFTMLGLRASQTLTFSGMAAVVRGTAGWRHGFGDMTPDSTQAFAGGAAFTVAGVPIAEDSAVVDVGVGFAIAEGTTLGVSYGGLFSSDTQDNSASLGLAVRF